MPTARFRVSLVVLGAAASVYAIGLAIWEPGALTLPVAVHVAIGWSFLAAGIVAWERRPENRTGLLMMLTGVVWFGRDFDWWGASIPTHLSDLSQNVFLALIAHQVIVFPHGAARSRSERALVRTAYALALGGYVLSELIEAANDVLSVVAIVVLGAIVVVVVERWRAATVPERRTLEPLLWAGPPVLVVAALSVARDYLDVSLSAAGDTALDWAQLVYTAIPLAFLAGLLRVRLHRAGIGELVVDLAGGVTSPQRVRDALARTLGDPSLEIAFWLPAAGRYVDPNGRRVEPRADGLRAVKQLERGGEPLAALVYDPSLLEDATLVEAAGAAAGLALENARLQTELHAQLELRRAGQSGSAADAAPALEGPLADLTTRELEVLALIAEGRTDRGIAQQLYVTPKTVEAHVRSILRKLDLPAGATENRRVHAVLKFLRARERTLN
jgi:DNA-binding NarL/FixJ family response regulator